MIQPLDLICDSPLLTECAQRKCPSHFEQQGHSEHPEKIRHRRQLDNNSLAFEEFENNTLENKDILSANNMNTTTEDFNGLDIKDQVEVNFFTHPAWKDISECDALIREPAKVAPCEF